MKSEARMIAALAQAELTAATGAYPIRTALNSAATAYQVDRAVLAERWITKLLGCAKARQELAADKPVKADAGPARGEEEGP